MMQVIVPASHDLGMFKVRRTLPSPRRIMVGPFIFVDQFGPAQFDVGQGMDVRPHPHIGLATVTYLFEGAIDHRDSLGTFATIRPGALNLMTAGRGIVHSERTPMPERAAGSRISGMQTWLALPDGREEIAPAFEHVAADLLPVIEGDGVRATLIIGSLWGKSAPTTQYAETIYADIAMRRGASLPVDGTADERAIILVSGAASLDGTRLDPFNLYILEPDVPMQLRATEDCRLMLLGGEAFAKPRHVWWNFVSSSRDRIRQATEDWNAGNFAKVPGDEVEAIPIPQVPLTRSDA